ncbi:MAG: winged helix-turn-helix domain-containing protein [Shewanella sp.]
MIEYQIENAIVFQPARFRLVYNEIEKKLSKTETKVLLLLCKYALNVVERGVFLRDIWDDREGSDANLNKSVLNLRRKFQILGYVSSIETVPRVGYMLRLNAFAIEAMMITPEAANAQPEAVDAQPEAVDAQPEAVDALPEAVDALPEAVDALPEAVDALPVSTSNPPTKKTLAPAGYRRFLPYLILVVAALLPIPLYRLYALYIAREDIPLAHKMAYVSPLLTIFEMAGVEQSVNYPAFISQLRTDSRMLVSISNSAISFIGTTNEGQRNWSKVFILDQDKNINSQLACIANYIKNSRFIDNDLPQKYATAGAEHGSAFHKKRFFSPCTDTQPGYLGEIIVNSTHYPGDSTKSRMPSSLIQNVLFNDKHDDPVFHFTSISRVNHINEGKHIFDFFVNLSIKSLKIEFINQRKISSNKYINMIFNEYEDDEIFLKSLSAKDDFGITVLSSAFDGTLSEGIAFSDKLLEPFQKELSDKK